MDTAKLRSPAELFGVTREPDFSEHNREVRRLWEDFERGCPRRIPMILGVNSRHIILDPQLNPEGIPFSLVFSDPAVMLEIQTRFAYYMRHFIPSDREMGLPERWDVGLCTMNTFEAEWFGAPRRYISGDIPEAEPFITDDAKYAPLERGLPDIFSGRGGEVLRLYEYFLEAKERGFECEGVPLGSIGAPFGSTDGPMTVACAIRGATQFCLDLYEDPDYARALLDYVTEATICRVKAWRRYLGQPEKTPGRGFGFADDSIALLSTADYERFILPSHLRLKRELGDPSAPTGIHLCGDAARHFPLLAEKLNINAFDTGFPIRHGDLVRRMGPDIRINGGPTVGLLLSGTPEAVYAETLRIIDEVRPYTRKFVMREANNLAPRTPPENVAAMYRAVREGGCF